MVAVHYIVDRGVLPARNGRNLPRYSVWKQVYPRREPPEIVALGDDLGKLQEQHGPDLEVVDHSSRSLRRSSLRHRRGF